MSEQDNESRQSDLPVDGERRKFLKNAVSTAGGAAAVSMLSAGLAPGKAMAHPSHEVPNPMAPLHEVAGKVAFITGGSSGIGLGIARACSEAGMKVIITYRTPSHLEEAKTYFEGEHAGFHAIRLDVTDREAMVRAADEAEATFGNIHLMVNNAGVGVGTPLTQGTYNDWDFCMGVNVNGIFNGIHVFVPRIIAHGEPAQIIATSSMSGLFIGATAGIYTTSKYAVVGMMEGLRAELEPHGIGASVFCPGVVRSNIGQSDRNRPDELQNPESEREEQEAARAARRQRQQQEMSAEEMEAMRERFRNAAMDPLVCGRKVLRGVRRNDLFIITHPEYGQGIEDRSEALIRSIPAGDPPPPPARLMVEERVLTAQIYVDEIKKLKGYGY